MGNSNLALPSSSDLDSYKIRDRGQSLLEILELVFRGLEIEQDSKNEHKKQNIRNLFFIINQYYASYIH